MTMARASTDDRKAYSRQHYLENRDKYNPKRKADYAARLANISALYDASRIVVDSAVKLSRERWVSPSMIMAMCNDQASSLAVDVTQIFDRAASLIEKDWRVSSTGVRQVGLLMGRPVFDGTADSLEEHVFQLFVKKVKSLPKRSADGNKAELCILNLVLKNAWRLKKWWLRESEMVPTTRNVATFGDSRRIILETIVGLRDGSMDISRGMAIAANMKVLNDSVQVEINRAKMVLLAQEAGHDFGRIVHMGMQVIGSNAEDDEGEDDKK